MADNRRLLVTKSVSLATYLHLVEQHALLRTSISRTGDVVFTFAAAARESAERWFNVTNRFYAERDRALQELEAGRAKLRAKAAQRAAQEAR